MIARRAVEIALAVGVASCGRVGFAARGGDDAGADAAPGSSLRAYVTCAATPGSVLYFEVDEAAGRLVSRQSIATELDPETAVATGDWLYVGNAGSSDVSIFHVDAATGQLESRGSSPCDTGVKPKSMQIDPSARFLYVGSEVAGSSAVDVLTRDANTGELLASGSASTDSGSNVRMVELVGGAQKIVSANWYVATLTQLDIGADGLLGAATSIPTTDGPVSVAIDPSGTHLYVGGQNANAVAWHPVGADGTVGAVAGSIAGPNAPVGLALDPAGATLYAIGFFSNDVVRYSVTPQTGVLQLVDSVPTGMAPGAVAIDPLGRYLFVTNYDSEDLWLFAIASDGSLVQADRATCPAAGASSVTVSRVAVP